MISDNVVLANQLNLYLSNIGSNIASQIVTSDEKSYTDYLHSPCKIEFKFKEITVQYTKEIIDSLKAKKQLWGRWLITVKLLKLIKDEMSTSLTLVINQSLISGIFPDHLKIAKVIPIYKKDYPAIFGNYRPISIVPVNIVYFVVHIVYEADVIANSLMLYLQFCSTLNKIFFFSSSI